MSKIFGIVAAIVMVAGIGAANAHSVNRVTDHTKMMKHDTGMNGFSSSTTNPYQSSPEGRDPSWRRYPAPTGQG